MPGLIPPTAEKSRKRLSPAVGGISPVFQRGVPETRAMLEARSRAFSLRMPIFDTKHSETAASPDSLAAENFPPPSAFILPPSRFRLTPFDSPFLEANRLAGALTKIIKLGTTDDTATFDFDLGNAR